MPDPSILLVDNRDSFTYNLVESFRRIGASRIDVVALDDLTPDRPAHHDYVVLSPGPGLPVEYPACFELLRVWQDLKPILGICLGHQIIGLHYGARLEHLGVPSHGRQADVSPVEACPVGSAAGGLFKAGLYHSWRLSPRAFPHDALAVTAREQGSGSIMAVRHREHAVFGLQFHPESVLTPCGDLFLEAFLCC